MNKLLKIVGSAVALSTLLAVTIPALGAGWGWERDAGAKARGDYGHGAAAQSQMTHARNYTYARSTRAAGPVAETRQSFSYEPALSAPLHVGDSVVVISDSAPLMLGHKVLTNVPKGTNVVISEVQGDWLGTHLQSDGQSLAGWVAAGDVAR